MQNKIEKLSDHYIVCGFGRMGNHICTDLKNAGVPFVVIENNPDRQKNLMKQNTCTISVMLPVTVLF